MINTSLKQKSALSTTQQPIHSLRPDPRNPRLHNTRQVNQIAQSIKTFGFNVPILVDGNNIILSGHGRWLACQKLGWQEAPVIKLEHLTEAQARAFAIADNKLCENATWNTQLLAEIFLELNALDLDFSIEDTGFTMGEIDLHIEGLNSDQSKTDSVDTLPPHAGQPAVSKIGDLWLLGKHRILCGNALVSQSYEVLMPGKQAHLIFTDPPYNVPIAGHVSGKGNTQHREFAMASGEMSPAEFTTFLTATFQLLAAYSKPGSIHFICMDWRHTVEIMTAGKAVYSEHKNTCVWTKDNAGMGSLYRSQHEFVFVFKHGTAPHQNNVELGKYGRYRTNVWHYPGVNSLSRQGKEGNLLALHPTVKPVALIADAILDCSARGDIILDCFSGSGSTLLAAERTGRIAYAMEIDPLYVDTAIRRWQSYCGESALHAVTGQTFNSMAAHAEVSHD